MSKYVLYSKWVPFADGDRVIDGDLSGVIRTLDQMGIRHETRTRAGCYSGHRMIRQSAVFADNDQLARIGITLTDVSVKRGRPIIKAVDKF